MARLPVVTPAYAYGGRPSLSPDVDIPFGYFSIEDFISIFIERERALTGGSWTTVRVKYRSLVLDLLAKGEIGAYLYAVDGRIIPLNSSDWHENADNYNVITMTNWRTGFRENAINDEGIELDIDDNIIKGNIVVFVEHATRCLANHDPQARVMPNEDVSNIVGEKNRTNKGPGRPQKYDVELFMLEMMAIVMDEGRPNTQAELKDRTVKAYIDGQGKGGEPDEEWARKKVSRFWNRLQLGEER